MSLKVEQRLKGCEFTEGTPRIYSTGVYLVPMKIQVHGIDQFVWVVDDFNDDTFDSDGKNIPVKNISDTKEDLFK